MYSTTFPLRQEIVEPSPHHARYRRFPLFSPLATRVAELVTGRRRTLNTYEITTIVAVGPRWWLRFDPSVKLSSTIVITALHVSTSSTSTHSNAFSSVEVFSPSRCFHLYRGKRRVLLPSWKEGKTNRQDPNRLVAVNFCERAALQGEIYGFQRNRLALISIPSNCTGRAEVEIYIFLLLPLGFAKDGPFRPAVFHCYSNRVTS